MSAEVQSIAKPGVRYTALRAGYVRALLFSCLRQTSHIASHVLALTCPPPESLTLTPTPSSCITT